MLPKPIADPETARIKAKRDDQWPCKDVRRDRLPASSVSILFSVCALNGAILDEIGNPDNTIGRRDSVSFPYNRRRHEQIH